MDPLPAVVVKTGVAGRFGVVAETIPVYGPYVPSEKRIRAR